MYDCVLVNLRQLNASVSFEASTPAKALEIASEKSGKKEWEKVYDAMTDDGGMDGLQMTYKALGHGIYLYLHAKAE